MLFYSHAGPNTSPIGIFDSGVGGLSVVKDIQVTLPFEQLIYIADSEHAPYGEKSADYITERCHSICQFLISRQVKAIVIACNTATVSCIKELRATYSLPILGLEPSIKPAAIDSKTSVIGVLATAQTVASGAVQQLMERFDSHAKIIVQGCPGLVEQVEHADLNSEKTALLLHKYLQPMLDAGADTIVMGCTHYAFLMPLIQKIVGPKITLLTSGLAVSKELKRRLRNDDLLNNSATRTKLDLYSNNPKANSVDIINALVDDTFTFLPFKN